MIFIADVQPKKNIIIKINKFILMIKFL